MPAQMVAGVGSGGDKTHLLLNLDEIQEEKIEFTPKKIIMNNISYFCACEDGRREGRGEEGRWGGEGLGPRGWASTDAAAEGIERRTVVRRGRWVRVDGGCGAGGRDGLGSAERNGWKLKGRR